MKKKTFVYIAGPYRGQTHDWRSYIEIDANINRAREAAKFCAENGLPFYCPHTHAAHFEVITPNLPPEFWYEMDSIYVALCSAILLVNGWEQSAGTLAETERAYRMGKLVFLPNEREVLVEWWRQGDSK